MLCSFGEIKSGDAFAKLEGDTGWCVSAWMLRTQPIKFLGNQYYHGNSGVKKDVMRAIKLWEEAAELGSTGAHFDIGEINIPTGLAWRRTKQRPIDILRRPQCEGTFRRGTISAVLSSFFGDGEGATCTLKGYGERCSDKASAARAIVCPLSAFFVRRRRWTATAVHTTPGVPF